MTTYLIKYQIYENARQESLGQDEGLVEWLDTESRVVAGEDAREAVDEIVDYLNGKSTCRGFRLKSIEIVGHADIIVRQVVFDQARNKILE